MRWRIAWLLGLISKRSCQRADGSSKVRYGSRVTAEIAALVLSTKYNKPMDAYRCWFHCRKWHIGESVFTDQDKQHGTHSRRRTRLRW